MPAHKCLCGGSVCPTAGVKKNEKDGETAYCRWDGKGGANISSFFVGNDLATGNIIRLFLDLGLER
jgi:hypothetical protein